MVANVMESSFVISEENGQNGNLEDTKVKYHQLLKSGSLPDKEKCF